MKCPHCGESVGEITCPACERSIPEESRYCCWCGEGVTESADEVRVELADAADEGTIDFASRKLCSDGTCIGVIGADNRCKECGKPYSGEPEVD